MAATLRAALTGEPDLLDPATSSIYTGAQVYEHIFSKLIDFDASGNFVPDLATLVGTGRSQDLEVQPRHQRHLPQWRELHFGRREIHASSASSTRRPPAPMPASTRRSSRSTRPIRRSPSSTSSRRSGRSSTNLATNGEIVNKKAIESGDPARNPVGTGPFKFVEWVQGDHLTLEEEPDLLQGRAAASRCHHLPLPARRPEPHRRAFGRRARLGRTRSRCSRFRAQKDDPRFTYVTSPVAGIPDFMALNTKPRPSTTPRSARPSRLRSTAPTSATSPMLGTGELGPMEMPTGSPWYDLTGVFAVDQDVAKAKASARRGRISQWPHCRVSRPAAISGAAEDRPGNARAAQGHRHRHDRSSRSTCRSGTTPSSTGNYQITSAYQERTIDPDNFYSLVLKSGGPINTVGYSNADVDALIDKAAASVDDGGAQGASTARSARS